VRLSRRVENLPPYLFVEISRKIAERKARGEDVVSFGIGDPDIPRRHISSRDYARKRAYRRINVTQNPKPPGTQENNRQLVSKAFLSIA